MNRHAAHGCKQDTDANDRDAAELMTRSRRSSSMSDFNSDRKLAVSPLSQCASQ